MLFLLNFLTAYVLPIFPSVSLSFGWSANQAIPFAKPLMSPGFTMIPRPLTTRPISVSELVIEMTGFPDELVQKEVHRINIFEAEGEYPLS